MHCLNRLGLSYIKGQKKGFWSSLSLYIFPMFEFFSIYFSFYFFEQIRFWTHKLLFCPLFFANLSATSLFSTPICLVLYSVLYDLEIPSCLELALEVTCESAEWPQYLGNEIDMKIYPEYVAKHFLNRKKRLRQQVEEETTVSPSHNRSFTFQL